MATRSTDVPLPIIVGVDGTEDSERAMKYAVREARRRGCGIRLVHATSEASMVTPMLPLIALETMLETGHRIVDESLEDLREMAPDIEVTGEVRSGTRGPTLALVGEKARMIVLGHRHLPALERVIVHSTANSTVAHAHCPVVSVPSSWESENSRGVVLVGVDESSAAKDALARGFAEAAVRGARVRLLHSWRLPMAYDDIIVARLGEDRWQQAGREHLETVAAPWREIYPEVEVEFAVVHDEAARALVQASRNADLVVVGRSGPGGPLAFHVGGIARALLRGSWCPVEIVPIRSATGEEHDPRFDASSEAAPQA